MGKRKVIDRIFDVEYEGDKYQLIALFVPNSDSKYEKMVMFILMEKNKHKITPQPGTSALFHNDEIAINYMESLDNDTMLLYLKALLEKENNF